MVLSALSRKVQEAEIGRTPRLLDGKVYKTCRNFSDKNDAPAIDAVVLSGLVMARKKRRKAFAEIIERFHDAATNALRTDLPFPFSFQFDSIAAFVKPFVKPMRPDFCLRERARRSGSRFFPVFTGESGRRQGTGQCFGL